MILLGHEWRTSVLSKLSKIFFGLAVSRSANMLWQWDHTFLNLLLCGVDQIMDLGLFSRVKILFINNFMQLPCPSCFVCVVENGCFDALLKTSSGSIPMVFIILSTSNQDYVIFFCSPVLKRNLSIPCPFSPRSKASGRPCWMVHKIFSSPKCYW